VSDYNFGMGYPPDLQALLQGAGSTVSDPNSPAAQQQRALDAWKTMNGGGYVGGVVNAPTQYAGPAPAAAPAPAGGAAPGGTPGWQTQAGWQNAVNHVPAALADKFASFFQNGPGFSNNGPGYQAPGMTAPAPASSPTSSPLDPWSQQFGDMTITEGYSPYGQAPTAPVSPTTSINPYQTTWAGNGKKSGGWGGWGG
jgi:hypothetical protein